MPTKHYDVYNDPSHGKEISWDMMDDDDYWPTIADIITVAKKEFPGVPLEKLVILPSESTDGITLAEHA